MFKIRNHLAAVLIALGDFFLLPLLLLDAGCKPKPGKSAFDLLMGLAFPFRLPWRAGPLGFAYFVKDGEDDPAGAAVQKSLQTLTGTLSKLTTDLDVQRKDAEKTYRELTNGFSGLKDDQAGIRKTVDELTAKYTDALEKVRVLTDTIDSVKRELAAPIFRGGSDLKDADHKAAIDLQRQLHIAKGGDFRDFRVDEKSLIPGDVYRSVAYKLALRFGLDTRETIARSFTDIERKAFEASGMDSGFFSPQMLGIEVDCNILCSEMLDLYYPVTVSKSTFGYVKVEDYASIGSYQCDAKCDAELGPEGNIRYLMNKTFDWRGAFCVQKKTLQEADYDLFGFMTRSILRSYNINRNRALIVGDGVNEPLGWLTAKCFTPIKTGALKFDHVAFRRFLASCPVEYGAVTATMHQNVFAYLASQTDAEGRFIFGDGLITFSPDDARERIRISNCLPDPTNGGVLGDAANPFVAGSFIAAAGNWQTAYASVSKRPVFIEQWMGQTTAWCAKYQFGAEDGGFPLCCASARTLEIGA